METTVKERLLAFINYRGLSIRKFEQSVGLSNGYVNGMKNSIQPNKVQKISQQYPELSTGWLLSGEGEMLKTTLPEKTDGNLTTLVEIVKSQQETIRDLTRLLGKGESPSGK